MFSPLLLLHNIDLLGQLCQQGLAREQRQLGGRCFPCPLPARTPDAGLQDRPKLYELKKANRIIRPFAQYPEYIWQHCLLRLLWSRVLGVTSGDREVLCRRLRRADFSDGGGGGGDTEWLRLLLRRRFRSYNDRFNLLGLSKTSWDIELDYSSRPLEWIDVCTLQYGK